MKAVVTGAAGFVGSHLCEALIQDGYEVVGIDSMTDYYSTSIKRFNLSQIPAKRFTFVDEDLSEVPLETLLNEADLIFHQAGQPGVRKSWGSYFLDYAKHNIAITQRLLEFCKDSPSLKRFIYASSSSVYGNSEAYPTSESTLPRPNSPYGVSKLAAEHLCSLYGLNYGVPTVSLRYFTVYGPRQRPDMAFSRFIRCALAGETLSIYGDGNQIRDFTYIADVVRANLLACNVPVTPGQVMNIAGGTQASMNEVVALIGEITARDIDVIYTGAVAGDVARTAGDITLAKELLNWTPKVSLSDGLAEQVYHMQAQFRNRGAFL